MASSKRDDPTGTSTSNASRAAPEALRHEPHRLVLRRGEGIVCELLAVVRAHLDSMPGAGNDRPGADRVRLRMPSGDEVVTDVWSRGTQDIRRAPRTIQVFDHGDVVGWRVHEASATQPEPANDDPRLKLVG